MSDATKTAAKPVKKAAAVAPVKIEPYKLPFTLGADPEFTVMSGGRPMNARDILSTFFQDAAADRSGFNFAGGNIGWDGHAATGELRPKPGTPAEVVANLKNLFEEAQNRMPFADLSTLTIASPTGGHIHLAIPEAMGAMAESRNKKYEALERALAAFIILPMLGENTLSRETRKRGGSYGSVMDFRTDTKFTYPSGVPGYTLEVRALTAEWITTEKIALGTLVYFAIVWDNLLNNNIKGIEDILFTTKKQAQESVSPLLANFANFQKMYLNKVRPWIRMHPLYAEYKDAVELVLNPERCLEAKKKAHYSISEGWGLTKDSKSIKIADFNKEDDIEEKTSKFPENIIRNLSQFTWNEDINVQAFATALGKRCIALGWKPNHEYFLFGLKKGMDALILRDEDGSFLSGQELIKNKGDYDLIAKKFERLAPKAAPGYARFINPRTGELDDGSMRRVMIGLPYSMRQKMDIRPLIKLVLKFEKNTKSLPALDRETLPAGESKIKAELDRHEKMEDGINQALEKSDRQAPIPSDVVTDHVEARDSRNLRAQGTAVTPTRNQLFPGMSLHNLASWAASNGTFGVFHTRNLATLGLEGNSLPVALRAIMGTDQWYAWFGGNHSTIIGLGENWLRAAEFLGRIFGVTQETVLSNMGREYNSSIYGWMAFSQASSRSHIVNYNNRHMANNVMEIVSEWNNAE